MAATVSLSVASIYVERRFAARIRTVQDVPSAPVALVFGAGLTSGGEPSKMLAERVSTAIDLYRAGKVEKLLLSGDNTARYHDETRAMRRYAIERGLAPEALLRDVRQLLSGQAGVRGQQGDFGDASLSPSPSIVHRQLVGNRRLRHRRTSIRQKPSG